jgi:DNA ligase-1
MRAFAALYQKLDATNKTNRKLAALRDYLAAAAPGDAAWAVYFLCGRKLKRLISSTELRTWGAEAAGVPDWLFDECYLAVGDLAETMALLLPPPTESSAWPLSQWVDERLERLRHLDKARQRELLRNAWMAMDAPQRLVWNKIITGSFRVGVSTRLVIRALAEVAGKQPADIAHQLMGDWQPTPDFFSQVVGTGADTAHISRPYPFFLAHPLEQDPRTLGLLDHWQVEWKWDGIRAQLLRRGGRTFLWSRGEELVTECFPEILPEAERLLDGTALDGELLAWREGVLPFAALQQRIGRKNLGKRILAEVPVAFLAFDVLEYQGRDIRSLPLHERRARLVKITSDLAAPKRILLSPTLAVANWDELALLRQESRARRVEGLMLKRLDSAYGVGRQRGPWWKWKIDPYSVDAVLISAEMGHGRRASLYTDYTFGLWQDGVLVPFAKAYSGLTDEEIREVDRFVRRNTLERFGPVRRVKADLVFEIAFEGIQASARHKSGVAVRFPRMARWRRDKTAADADTLDRLRGMLKSHGWSKSSEADDQAPLFGQ